VLGLKFSPPDDEQLVAAAAANHAIRVRQIENIKAGAITDDQYIFRVHNNWVNCTAYLKQGHA
jgi:hypothetical protein